MKFGKAATSGILTLKGAPLKTIKLLKQKFQYIPCFEINLNTFEMHPIEKSCLYVELRALDENLIFCLW